MNKKIMLLALAAVSAAVLALPATASALVPLHLNPTPEGPQQIDGNGIVVFSTTGGSTQSCQGFAGSATFDEGGTTGSMSLTFSKCTILGSTCDVATTTLPFHLITLPGEHPGILITANNGHFANFSCFFFPLEVTGNGWIGTITFPECGQTGNEATIAFNTTAHGVQEHTTVTDTETVYALKRGSESFGLDAHGTLTLSEETELECT